MEEELKKRLQQTAQAEIDSLAKPEQDGGPVKNLKLSPEQMREFVESLRIIKTELADRGLIDDSGQIR